MDVQARRSTVKIKQEVSKWELKSVFTGLPKNERGARNFLGRGVATEQASFSPQLGENEQSEVRCDEVKLERAHGECLGIRSRRRT